MTAPDTQPQGETRTLAQQLRACADAVTTAALLDRRRIVAATLRDLAERAAETELRADQAENARDQVGRMLHAAQERLTSVLVVAEQVRRYADWPGRPRPDLVPEYSYTPPPRQPQDVLPRGGRNPRIGCEHHQSGTWIHGAPHDCPTWARR